MRRVAELGALGITTMRITSALFTGLLICLTTGCTTTRLTIHQAAEIATQLAKKDGEKMERYQAPRASFDSQRKKWSVFWDEIPPGVPGGYLWIEVDDQSGTAERKPSL